MALTDAEIMLVQLNLRGRRHDNVGPHLAARLARMSRSTLVELEILSRHPDVHPLAREAAATARWVAEQLGDPEEHLLAQEASQWTK